jgi:hypothetical protein
MAEILFISEKDLTTYTNIDGNVDKNKYVQYIRIAQDIHVQSYMGTKLFEAMKTKIESGTINSEADYLELLNEHIKPMTIYWTMVEFLPHAVYTIANKGVYKHFSDNADVLSPDEVSFLVEKNRDIAQNYSRRFVDYMCFNAPSKFPEYYENKNEDLYPEREANFNGWHL